MPSRDFNRLLKPSAIAVVGASPRESATGHAVLRNLQEHKYPGAIYPVNPRYKEVLGLRCYPSLSSVPRGVEAAFLAVPAQQGPDLLEEAGRCEIPAVFVNASGYADGGPEGRELQERLSEIAKANGIAVCGPNNIGLINYCDRIPLWAQPGARQRDAGSVAVISQSGSIAIALDEDERRLGLAYVITVGNEAVCSAADYLNYVVRDDNVRIAAVLIEQIRDPETFAEAARAADARGKRIIALKLGRTETGSRLVSAHTGVLSDDATVCDAFFQRYGIVGVSDLDELVETAVLFSAYTHPPSPPKALAVTLSGGEAALVADLATQSKLPLSDLSAATVSRLRGVLPSYVSVRNPVDVWGSGWSVEGFQKILDRLLEEPEAGVVLCAIDATTSGGGDTKLLCQMAAACTERAADACKRFVFLNNMSGRGTSPAVSRVLERGNIPYLSGMRPGLLAISHWLRYQGVKEHALPVAKETETEWRRRVTRASSVSESENFALLREVGVPMVPSFRVANASAAVKAAERVGYPVVLKATAPGLTHKSDLGMVRLGLTGADAVVKAFTELTKLLEQRSVDSPDCVIQPMIEEGVELIIGVRNDRRFGPLIVLGLGGIYVETLKEASVRLAPVQHDAVLEMLSETHAGTLLAGVRGRGPFDRTAVVEAVVNLSQFGVAVSDLMTAIEINPLIVRKEGGGVLGVDLLIEFDQRAAQGS